MQSRMTRKGLPLSRRFVLALSALVGFIAFVTLKLRGPSPLRCGSTVRARNPFEALYRNDTRTQCQETIYQPFLVGCPESCQSFRPELNEEEPLYRVTLKWYFGQAKLQNHLPLPVDGDYYSMGFNYQSCPKEFVDAFGQASDYLETTMADRFPDLSFKTQRRMHVSLAYLCCLRQQEAYHAREIMHQFVKKRTFQIPSVTFERIECWKERFNSITNIAVVDNASQIKLLDLLEELVRDIEGAGIPIKVSRLTQMPFHSTLLGIQLGEKYSLSEEHNIDRALTATFETIGEINDNWEGYCFDIQHDPKFSFSPVQHTNL